MNGNHAVDHAKMNDIFPDALKSLKEADPEVYSIIEDEKRRQW